jgi:hypothetical protein
MKTTPPNPSALQWLRKSLTGSLAALLLSTAWLWPAPVLATTKKVVAELEVANGTGGDAEGYRIVLAAPRGATLKPADVTVNLAGTPWTGSSVVVGQNANEVIISWKGATIANAAKAKMKYEVAGDKQPQVTHSLWTDGTNPLASANQPPAPTQKIVGDPQYVISNVLAPDQSATFRVSGLQFKSDVPEVPLDSLAYDPAGTGFDNPRANFDLASGISNQFSGLPEINGTNFLYAQGQLLDPANNNQLGTFVGGWQRDAPACTCTPTNLPPFANAGLDQFLTMAAFKIVYVAQTYIGGSVINVTVPGLWDTNTVIGRSDPFREGDPVDNNGALICCTASYLGTTNLVLDELCRLPANFPSGPDTRREVHTEILSLLLTNDASLILIQMDAVSNAVPAPGAITIRAGSPYWSDLQTNGPTNIYKNSFGEVASLCCGNPTNILADFPAQSFFHVYAEVEVNLPGTLVTKMHNTTPMVVSCQITNFPPNLKLPTSTYIHDPNFGPVALYDTNGLLVAYLLSAGHGASTNVNSLRPDAPRLLTSTVCFSAISTNLCNTNGPLPANSQNAAWANPLPADRPLSVYQSPSLAGGTPDTSNGHLPLPPSAGFAPGDAIKSFSFGRDGTASPFDPHACTNNTTPGAFYFSVSCASVGAACSDVAINTTPRGVAPARGAAADLYASGGLKFGTYTNQPVLLPPAGDNLLAIDAGQLGLSPGDNLTGAQLRVFNNSGTNRDFLYLTMTGPSFTNSFTNNGATIYMFDPTNSAFAKSNLTVFALASQLGLSTNDVIDALVLSDVTPGIWPQSPNRRADTNCDEVLFSLAPNSPSLAANRLGIPLSAADILYSKFDGTFALFAWSASLGLLFSDDVDALAVQPGMNLQMSCAVEPAYALTGVGNTNPVVFTGIPNGLPPYTFQWLSNGVPILGATNITYTNPPPSSAMTNLYTLLATNPFSNISATGRLEVIPPPNLVCTVAPAAATVSVGGSTNFSAFAYGLPPISIQWLTNGVPVPGATNETYTTAPATPADNGKIFTAVVTNAYATNNCSALLNVAAPASPVFTNIVVSGGNVTASGRGGSTSSPYYVLVTTNLVLPRANWTRVQTNSFNTSGNFSFTLPVNGPRQFYCLRVP